MIELIAFYTVIVCIILILGYAWGSIVTEKEMQKRYDEMYERLMKEKK